MSSATEQTVKVVTDSTADMPDEMVQRLGVECIPLTVLIGDETFRDGIDITPHEFYQRLPKLKKLPTTSQPAPGQFMQTYQKAVDEGFSVLSLHISSKLSGTYANATVAARGFPEGQIRVIDTQMVSAAIAIYVEMAANMAKAGHTIDEIEKAIIGSMSRMRTIVTVNTLEYLHKGGRIGGMRNILGSLLSVKPIFHIKDGQVTPLEQVRTRSKALQRVAAIVKSWGPIERLAIMHADDPDSAGELANLISAVFPLKDMFISQIGPVVGAHVGPGTVGVCALAAK